MLAQKEKEKKKGVEKQSSKKNRFLITVNVLGSAGPIRFVVNEEDNVKGVIDTALKMYAREGRLPVLGSDVSNFLLYPANAGSDGMSSISCPMIFRELFRLCSLWVSKPDPSLCTRSPLSFLSNY